MEDIKECHDENGIWEDDDNRNVPEMLEGCSSVGNGQCLSGFEIPFELLDTLLRAIELEDVVNASEVCILWKETIRNPVFWKEYYRQRTQTLWSHVHDHVAGRPDEWAVHFAVCKHDIFGKNLLQNPFGMEGLLGWRILSGDDRMDVEQEEIGMKKRGWEIKNASDIRVRDFPVGLGPQKCFVTDEFSCSKEQRIDLWAVGFTPAVMRACVPFTFRWSAYVGTPPEHEGFHEMYIRLLNKSVDDILEFCQPIMTSSSTLSAGTPFTKFEGSYTIKSGREAFEIMDRQLRYIYFYHGGMAKDNLSGHHGPHIYNPSVTIELFFS